MDLDELILKKLKETWDKVEEDRELYRKKLKEFQDLRVKVREHIKNLKRTKNERVLEKIIQQLGTATDQLDTVSVTISDSIIRS